MPTFQILQNPLTISSQDLGIFKSTLLPSFQLHSGLAVVAYLAGRYTNHVDLKDWLWPSGMVLNAIWSALGRRVYGGLPGLTSQPSIPLSVAWPILPWSEKLLLSLVTIWGTRLTYRIVTRSLARGEDDPRYAEVKKEKGFWNNALFSTFLPEAVMQTIISLPFTAPFRSEPVVALGADTQWAGVARSAAVGLFTAGMALEVLADWQLARYQEEGRGDLCTEGVFSIVRHPK
jgi:steroid 5-alpha reductase family enzyme